jgi:hypothetical protein
MKTPVHSTCAPSGHSTALLTALLTAFWATLLATPSAWAQSPATSQTSATTAEPSTTSGINPMTGRPLSEEDLHRQLNKSKLITQLGQEQVKQAQNAADLALANLRADSEKTRARAESLAQMAVTGLSKSGNVTVLKPLPASSGTALGGAPSMPNSGPSTANTGPSNPLSSTSAAGWSGPAIPSAPLPLVKASGTIRIGDETLDVSASTPPAGHALVQWVDSQTRQIARAGSPLSPINVQPATGVLGTPAIPGIMPGAMPPGLSQMGSPQ